MNQLPRIIKPGPPLGILLTMGQQVIDANGGIIPFIRHFTGTLDRGSFWYQKSRAAPSYDIAHVYIIVANRLAYRIFYGGYSKETDKTVFMLDGEERRFPWPHMILAGPVERCPHRIKMRGFQGFRYVYEPLF